jgi:hypothetical protein
MRTALQSGSLSDEAKIRLMDQSGGSQGVGGTLVSKVSLGEVAHFLVHKRYESVNRRLAALLPFDQQSGDFLGGRHRISLSA